MKLLKILKQIKEIKALNVNDFHFIKINNDIDFSTMCDLSEYLSKNNIKHILLVKDFNIKSISLNDKKELLEQVKKEIGLEE